MVDSNQIIGIALAVTALVLVYLYYSFGTLEPREIGILYNSIDKTVSKEPYAGGAHYIGLFNNFLHFPGGYETIEFSSNPKSNSKPLLARTSDGVSIGISVSFQYQLVPEELVDLYQQSGTDYERTFQNIARDTLLQTTSNYQAKQFWNDREAITSEMLAGMKTALKAAHANCISLQFSSMTIPENLEKKIVDTQVEKQLGSTKVYERETELIRQEIEIMNSGCDQNITSITAAAEAEALFVVKSAEATAKKRLIDIQSYVIGYTYQNLQLDSAEMSSYLILRAVEKQPNATITVGLNSTVIQIRTN